MQLVGVADIRLSLLAHLVDRRLIQRAQASRQIRVGTAQRHRAGPPLFQRGIVQEGEGVGVQDLVGHWRGAGSFHGNSAQLASLKTPGDLQQPVEIHRLVQAVGDGLVDQRMVGRGDGAGAVVLAGHLLGKNRGHQVFSPHALDRHRHAPPASIAQHGQRPVGVPAPPVGKHR